MKLIMQHNGFNLFQIEVTSKKIFLVKNKFSKTVVKFSLENKHIIDFICLIKEKNIIDSLDYFLGALTKYPLEEYLYKNIGLSLLRDNEKKWVLENLKDVEIVRDRFVYNFFDYKLIDESVFIPKNIKWKFASEGISSFVFKNCCKKELIDSYLCRLIENQEILSKVLHWHGIVLKDYPSIFQMFYLNQRKTKKYFPMTSKIEIDRFDFCLLTNFIKNNDLKICKALLNDIEFIGKTKFEHGYLYKDVNFKKIILLKKELKIGNISLLLNRNIHNIYYKCNNIEKEVVVKHMVDNMTLRGFNHVVDFLCSKWDERDEMLKLLLKHGLGLKYRNILMKAFFSRGLLNKIKILLKTNNYIPEICLLLASKNNHIECVKLIINKDNKFLKKSIIYSDANGNNEIVLFLKKYIKYSTKRRLNKPRSFLSLKIEKNAESKILMVFKNFNYRHSALSKLSKASFDRIKALKEYSDFIKLISDKKLIELLNHKCQYESYSLNSKKTINKEEFIKFKNKGKFKSLDDIFKFISNSPSEDFLLNSEKSYENILKLDNYEDSNFVFKIPKKNSDLIELGRSLNTCLGTYGEKILRGVELKVVAYKKNKPYVVIGFSPKDMMITQINLKENNQLNKDEFLYFINVMNKIGNFNYAQAESRMNAFHA